MRIVTAAIDPDLQEMHVPLSTALMGEAAGEADFAVRVVPEQAAPNVDVAASNTNTNTDVAAYGDADADADVDSADAQLSGLSLEAQKGEAEAALPSGTKRDEDSEGALGALAGTPHAPKMSSVMDRLRWDRKRNEAPGQGGEGLLEKRAWVIVPGMGHIGYVCSSCKCQGFKEVWSAA